jgi:hypothetical protein
MLAARSPGWRTLPPLDLKMPSNLREVSGLSLENMQHFRQRLDANQCNLFSFQGPHTQHRAHHSQTRVCARLIGLSYAQLRERREFGSRGNFGQLAGCVLSGDHDCRLLTGCAVTVEAMAYPICI